ncbi:VPLPA-CTERM sorting domain-containing protein [Tropicimonas sp. TH_r6]|uniref:VPLPA-CTERM sorting domain-containing protein n=1 Tax=Tropicimonas sp. TH_r6 TaxID=3082085 RepID=UPI002954F6E9|nr:VPLPA-CTERM sorting domain-containing protein [Tropicimonas sp. TH_r6]MDV7144883.1 VPLPA-CTERM sorting domain-containing protein [Tropicimonas sp. TH_r6]
MFKKIQYTLIAAGLSVAITGSSAEAAVIALDAFDADAVTYDFSNATLNATTAGNGFVSFSDGNVSTAYVAPQSGLTYTNNTTGGSTGGGFLRMDFAELVSAIGFDGHYNYAPVLFQVFDADDNLLDSSLTSPTGYGPITGFFGLDVGANLISYALASVPDRDSIHNLYMDNVIYQQVAAVPLPASLPMILVGLGGLGVVSRRRKAA